MNSIITRFLSRFQYVQNLLTAIEHLKDHTQRLSKIIAEFQADIDDLESKLEDYEKLGKRNEGLRADILHDGSWRGCLELKSKLEDYEEDCSNYETEPPNRGPEHVPTPLRARRESNE